MEEIKEWFDERCYSSEEVKVGYNGYEIGFQDADFTKLKK